MKVAIDVYHKIMRLKSQVYYLRNGNKNLKIMNSF